MCEQEVTAQVCGCVHEGVELGKVSFKMRTDFVLVQGEAEGQMEGQTGGKKGRN